MPSFYHLSWYYWLTGFFWEVLKPMSGAGVIVIWEFQLASLGSSRWLLKAGVDQWMFEFGATECTGFPCRFSYIISGSSSFYVLSSSGPSIVSIVSVYSKRKAEVLHSRSGTSKSSKVEVLRSCWTWGHIVFVTMGHKASPDSMWGGTAQHHKSGNGDFLEIIFGEKISQLKWNIHWWRRLYWISSLRVLIKSTFPAKVKAVLIYMYGKRLVCLMK